MDQSYKWNNYISRFHWRHVDLMDVLSGFQGRGRIGLDQMSQLLGFPGKLGLSGEGVWDAHIQGRSEDIRNYCETDVVNTYLIYLRFELNARPPDARGARAGGRDRPRGLALAERPHLRGYLDAWAKCGS